MTTYKLLLNRLDIKPSYIQCIITIIPLIFIFFPTALYASFIESTIGTAVVNDATATYYNPAALTLIKNTQIIPLGSFAYLNTRFEGTATQRITGFTQNGVSESNTHYYLPAIYVGVPTNKRLTMGFALIANFFNRDLEEHAILRYVQSNNRIQNMDFVPALGFKLNDIISIGAAVNISYANFILHPTTGIPSLTAPDSQSRNTSSALSWGADLGLIVKPTEATLIGFNYRSDIAYHFRGDSRLEEPNSPIANNYHFKFWTPARFVLSINHFLTKQFGLMATLQRIQWDIFNTITLYNVAVKVGSQALILPKAVVPYHLQNTWLLTLGCHYRINPRWIIRVAGSYNQSPAKGHYQVANGNSIILGFSMGYEIIKGILIDGSYAHAFIDSQSINILTANNIIHGVNTGFRDAVSLKLTFNFV